MPEKKSGVLYVTKIQTSEVYASASNVPFASLLASKLFGFNFVIHFNDILHVVSCFRPLALT